MMELRAYPCRTSTREHLRQLWHYREFVWSLVARNLKVKYQGSMLGFLWTLLNPLMTVAVLTIVFSRIVRLDVEHYWAFLLSGYFVWHFITQSVSASTYLLVEHADISRSIAYPQEAPVLAAAISRMIEFALELLLILIVLWLFHHGNHLPVGYLAVPWLVVILFVMVLAVMFPLATVSVYFRDVYHGLPLVMTTLFYITPIFYPASMVSGPLRVLYHCNPLVFLLTAFHQACYEGVFPSPLICAAMTGGSLSALLLGYVFFNRSKAHYAEIL